MNLEFQRTVGFFLEGVGQGGGVRQKMIMNFLLLATLNFSDGPLDGLAKFGVIDDSSVLSVCFPKIRH